jgi:hypothetical protein
MLLSYTRENIKIRHKAATAVAYLYNGFIVLYTKSPTYQIYSDAAQSYDIPTELYYYYISLFTIFQHLALVFSFPKMRLFLYTYYIYYAAQIRII